MMKRGRSPIAAMLVWRTSFRSLMQCYSFNRFVSTPFHTRLEALPDGLTPKGYLCRRYTQGKWEQKYHQHGG